MAEFFDLGRVGVERTSRGADVGGGWGQRRDAAQLTKTNAVISFLESRGSDLGLCDSSVWGLFGKHIHVRYLRKNLARWGGRVGTLVGFWSADRPADGIGALPAIDK